MSKQILTYIPLFFLLLLGQSVFCAEPETLEAAFKRVRPGSEPQAIIGFFKTNAPDLLDEIQAKRKDFPDAMDIFIAQLADRFAEIDAYRGEDQATYDRLVRQERQQCQVRKLAREIQRLGKPVEDKDADAQRQQDLAKAKTELKVVLETVFDESQQQQLIELNRLESEVRDLRRLANDRAANKDFILKQRFEALTGLKE